MLRLPWWANSDRQGYVGETRVIWEGLKKIELFGKIEDYVARKELGGIHKSGVD
jgi:hypothetical protein